MQAAAMAGVKKIVITGSTATLHGLPMVDLPLQTPDSWNTTSTAADGPYLAGKVTLQLSQSPSSTNVLQQGVKLLCDIVYCKQEADRAVMAVTPFYCI